MQDIINDLIYSKKSPFTSVKDLALYKKNYKTLLGEIK